MMLPVRAALRTGDSGWREDPQPATIYTNDALAVKVAAAGSYQRYCAEFLDAILGRGGNPATPAQAVVSMSVLETAAEAVNAACWSSLPLTDAECIAIGNPRHDIGT